MTLMICLTSKEYKDRFYLRNKKCVFRAPKTTISIGVTERSCQTNFMQV